jgi:hypothetical protein
MNEEEERRETIIPIRPYNNTELARIYGVDRGTIRNWLLRMSEKLGERTGNYWMIPQVKIIFKHLDLPSNIILRDETNFIAGDGP